MRIRMSTVGIAAVAMALALSTAACGSDTGAAAPARSAAAAGPPPSVALTNSSLGPILTDRAGRVLYAFVNDKGRTSTCVDECVATWPALAGVTPVAAGTGVEQALLGSVPRSEGTEQATYGDWPLYYYVGDALPGEVTGQGVDGEWFVVGGDGKLIRTGA